MCVCVCVCVCALLYSLLVVALAVCLSQRTVRIKNGIAEVRAGATLLYDSDPAAEEAETELKVPVDEFSYLHCSHCSVLIYSHFPALNYSHYLGLNFLPTLDEVLTKSFIPLQPTDSTILVVS